MYNNNVAAAMFPLRLRQVAGHGGRANDVLFAPPSLRPPCRAPALSALSALTALAAATDPRPRTTLVFFGGDVQDYPEVMQAHRDNKNYLKWNLESTALMLARHFPTHNIVVVRPSRIEYKSFSCYDNFVPSNDAGVPDHTPTHNALFHLERLLNGVSERLNDMPRSELMASLTTIHVPEDSDVEDLHKQNASTDEGAAASNSRNGSPVPSAGTRTPEESLWWLEQLSLADGSLTLVGFSKGCVVLNQLIYEFHYANTLTPEDEHVMRLMSRVRDMYWLDGGHAGGKNTWLTSRSLLETLTRLEVNIFIHVTPYQVQDEGRPWIGREEKTFTSILKKLGANVRRYLHGGGRPHSLHSHFAVLSEFKRVQDAESTDQNN